jgi:hypothetical protein
MGAWCLGEVTEERKASLVEGYRTEVLNDVKVLSPEEREFLNQYVRSLRDKGVEDDTMLFKLGDEEITRKWIELWNQGYQSHAEEIVEAARPEIIAKIAPSLLKNQPYKLLGSDIYSLPESFGTATVILSIIKNSGVFPIDVVRWSQSFDLENTSNPEKAWLEVRQCVRDWWTENQLALTSGRYQDVKPGRQWNSKFINKGVAEPEPKIDSTPPSRQDIAPSRVTAIESGTTVKSFIAPILILIFVVVSLLVASRLFTKSKVD